MTTAGPVRSADSLSARDPLRAPFDWWLDFGRPPRIMGLDIARALAVLGMVGAHIGGVGDQFVLGEPATWSAAVNGNPSVLFAVLAGVSVAILTGRSAGPDIDRMLQLRLSLVGRGGAIFVIGLLLELLNTPIGIILALYGLLYIALIPFLRWPSWRLFAAAGVLAIVMPALLALVFALTLGPDGQAVGFVLYGLYPITVWLTLALAGLGVGRLDLARADTQLRVLGVATVVSAAGYLIGALGGDSAGDVEPVAGGFSGWGSAWDDYAQAFASMAPWESVRAAFFSVEPHSGGTAEILASGGLALVVIALCLLLSRPLRWPLLPVAALGSMPLTAYTGHVVSVFLIAGPGGFIADGAAWAATTVVLILGATLWSMLFGRGPLERLVGRVATAAATVRR